MGEGIAAEILVVDDERAVRRGVAAILSGAGYVVREAKNGKEALRLFGEARPDLVLLDVMMPKMDGFFVCAAIREVDAAVPVLFLSALGDEESQLKGFGYGADAGKPHPHQRGQFGAGGIEHHHLAATRAESSQSGHLRSVGLRSDEIGEALARDWLAVKLWGKNAAVSDNLLSVLVYGLRGKLAAEGQAIRTVRGVGYVFAPSS